MLPGEKLKINALTQRTGYIRVELVEFDGKPIDGFSFDEADPVIGDQFWSEVTWNGNANLPVEKGTPVWFRIKMCQAKLYGLEFE